VERIVQNLLANVVRHTPVGTPLWIVVTAVDGGARISVKDTGPVGRPRGDLGP
jgi:signal transduction histidine kinase